MRDTEFLKRVGIEVRIARMRKQISVEELAKITRLQIHTIYRMEIGKSDFRILNFKKLTDALGMSLKDFF